MAKKRLLQALQDKNKLSELIIGSVEVKNFSKAKKHFDILKPTGHYKSILASYLLCQITTDFTKKDIEILLDTFKINIKELRFNHQTNTNVEVSFTSTPIIMNLLNKHWIQNQEQAKSLFKFFIKQGVPLKSKESYNNALIHTITTYPKNLGFIETLLKQGDIDVNSLITPDTDRTCKFSKTPFSVAISRLNKDLLLLLLKHGADPYLAIKSANKYMKTQQGKYKDYIITSGFNNCGLSNEEQQDYFYKVNNLIEVFFLNKLLTESSEFIQKSTILECKEEKTNKVKTASDSYKKASTLDKYIDYKKEASTDIKLPEKEREKHTFDSLILEWIKTKNTKHLDSINDLLIKAPADQYNYYLKCLIEMNPSNDEASELLAYTPSLLNKFCTLKKKIHNNKEKSKPLELQDGVFDLERGFKNKIFLKISPKLLEALNTKEAEKILNLLAAPKFIKANSMGISGIKDYPGQNISKLKIADTDSNLVSLTRYLDINGNLVIEFEHYLNHKEFERITKSGKSGQCIKCNDIGSMAYKSIEANLVSPTTPEPQDPIITVLGDDELLNDLE